MPSFDEWFKRATGNDPFPYQRRFAKEGEIPQLVDVPTGLGKTAMAVLGWLWRRETRPQDTPRRLVYCLPMRVLVEQTRTCAVRWLSNLGRLTGQAVFDGPRLMRYQVDWSEPSQVAVVTLMGGESQRDWHEYPERQVIIVGTQDMLLSRALNRGFAMSPQMWPVDFGLLNVDALWVMDEVQLMGPGRTTSVQLQHFWDEDPPVFGSRRTIWMSATLGAAPGSVETPSWMKSPERAGRTLSAPPHRYTDDDLSRSEFKVRWTAPKRLESHLDRSTAGTRTPQPARAKRKRGEGVTTSGAQQGWAVESPELLEQIRREAGAGRLVLIFVNQVRRARDLYGRLRDESGSGPDARLVHARMRPRDRKATETVLQDVTPPTGRIVITTQVLEAGVDIDADAVFTEVCPWPSLVQRLGRLNRSGLRPSANDVEDGKRGPAPAVVFEPPLPAQTEKESDREYEERRTREASLPYEARPLEETRQLLGKVEVEYSGSLSPETLARLPVSLPLEGPVLRRFDLDDLFDTDPDLAGGHADVAPLLRADRDVDAYILWRRIEGGLDAEEQVPIHRDELCPVPFYEAQKCFAEKDVWILTLATAHKTRAAWRRARGRDIHAGDTVMVDVGAGGYHEETGWTGTNKDGPRTVIDRWKSSEGQPVRAWVLLEPDGGRKLIEEIDGHVVGVRARTEDPRSFGKSWMELEVHLQSAERAAVTLVTTLDLPDGLKKSVTRAARWHDVGKALERDLHGETMQPFQNMLIKAGFAASGHPRGGVLYAKSNRSGGPSAGFRHEMASLLAFLDTPEADDDLAAFLILAHHGKVRLLPSAWNDEDPSDLCGVRDGDRIAAIALPDGGGRPVMLDLKKILSSREQRSWQGRVGRLLNNHGPFLLAYLEGLVRVADWRAS
ncbi:MAG: DEAD/DEAH box helicase [Deltaproteobacteria bacterium]|nr:DEAD/DEAH box helicase [Deltaproteobacteria bacterium]